MNNIAQQHVNGFSSFELAASLIFDLLFFTNSKPIHRQILSWCRNLQADKFNMATSLLVKLVNSKVTANTEKGQQMQPILLAEPLLSLVEFKPIQIPLR